MRRSIAQSPCTTVGRLRSPGPTEAPGTEVLNPVALDFMKAVICGAYGGPDVLRFAELPVPAVGPGDVLIRMAASAVTTGDRRVRSLDVPRGMHTLARAGLGWNRPRRRVPGAVFAGQVDQVGTPVSDWRVGDRVFGMDGFGMGCHAEFKLASKSTAMALIPPSLSFLAAASLPFGGLTARHAP